MFILFIQLGKKVLKNTSEGSLKEEGIRNE